MDKKNNKKIKELLETAGAVIAVGVVCTAIAALAPAVTGIPVSLLCESGAEYFHETGKLLF